jgi:hypothetical protein
MMTITSHHHRYLSLDSSCWLTDCCCDLLADALFCSMMISYVLEVFVMETIIASRGCACACVSLSLSLAVADCCCDVWAIIRSFPGCVYFARFSCVSRGSLVCLRVGRAEEDFAGQLRKLIQIPSGQAGGRQLFLLLALFANNCCCYCVWIHYRV